MPISGTLPHYSCSPEMPAEGEGVAAPFAGGVFPASGSASVEFSTEAVKDFYVRAVGILAISGAAVSGEVCITSAQASGIAHLQRELAARAADLSAGAESPNSVRIATANTLLTVSGEFRLE